MTTDLSLSERAFRPTWQSSLFGLAIDAALILDATRRLAGGSDPYAYVEIALFVIGTATVVPRLFGWQEVHLDFEGFETRTPWRWPWRRAAFRWSEVTAFVPITPRFSFSGATRVGFDTTTPGSDSDRRARASEKKQTGHECHVPAWGIAAEELAAIMERYRRHYGARNAVDSGWTFEPPVAQVQPPPPAAAAPIERRPSRVGKGFVALFTVLLVALVATPDTKGNANPAALADVAAGGLILVALYGRSTFIGAYVRRLTGFRTDVWWKEIIGAFYYVLSVDLIVGHTADTDASDLFRSIVGATALWLIGTRIADGLYRRVGRARATG